MKNYSKMFMDFAIITANQSNCVKYKVGAVIVKDNRIIIQGYNGTISGFINCNDKFGDCCINNKKDRIEHNIWSQAFEVHAEMNIISYAAKKGISLENTIMYCTFSPCNNCLKHLIQAGIKKVIYKNEYIDNANLDDREQLIKYIELEYYIENKWTDKF